MNGLRINAGEKGKVSRDHQALDMVSIGIFDGFRNYGRHAVHVGFARPVKARQRPVVLEEIAVDIVRPGKPVDATHIFPPADDLANETLDGIERCRALVVGALRRPADLQRIQQPAIDVKRQKRVVEIRVILQHGILRGAEIHQEIVYEGTERPLGIGAGDGETKVLKLAEIVGKQPLDGVDDIPCYPVRCEDRVSWPQQVRLGGAAVFRVKIPASTDRLFAIHQQASLATHFPVEIFHRQAFAPGRPALELLMAGKKAPIRADIDLDVEGTGEALDL